MANRAEQLARETWFDQRESVAAAPLKSGDGGGTFGGMTDPLPDLRHRVGRLEVGFCSAFVIVVLAAWALYSALHGDMRGIDDRLRSVEITQARAEGKLDKIDAKTSDMNERMTGIQRTLDERLPQKR